MRAGEGDGLTRLSSHGVMRSQLPVVLSVGPLQSDGVVLWDYLQF